MEVDFLAIRNQNFWSRAAVRPWTLCLKQYLTYSGIRIPKPNCLQEQ